MSERYSQNAPMSQYDPFAEIYDEWSQLCEAELNQLKPVEYPIASEIRAQPGYQSQDIVMDSTPVQQLEMK